MMGSCLEPKRQRISQTSGKTGAHGMLARSLQSNNTLRPMFDRDTPRGGSIASVKLAIKLSCKEEPELDFDEI